MVDSIIVKFVVDLIIVVAKLNIVVIMIFNLGFILLPLIRSLKRIITPSEIWMISPSWCIGSCQWDMPLKISYEFNLFFYVPFWVALATFMAITIIIAYGTCYTFFTL